MRSVSRTLFLICLAVCACGAIAQADSLEEFTRSKRELLRLLRSQQTSDRVAAVERLRKYPIADSVRLIFGALSDTSPEVHDAAYGALVKMNGNQEVCDTLLSVARKASHGRNGSVEAAAAPLAILLTSNLRSTQREVDELLGDAASRGAAPFVTALADELGNRHRAEDVLPLDRLAKTSVFANHFGVRRAVVHALTQIPTNESLGTLIGMMDRVGGEARADAVEHLVKVTGQIFGMESSAWQHWWAAEGKSFEYPSRSVATAYRTSLNESSEGYYYGLPLFAERLVYVLDTSGSMSGLRIAAAKRELLRSIAALPDYVHFGIVVFNSDVSVWQRQLVPANAQFKRAAAAYVNMQDVHSSTASYDALEAAFNFDTEAIYFLSDGAPNGGKISAPVDIVAAISAANQSRRISIYTIGIGAGFPGSPLDVFLKTLAEQNLGLYRRVDD